MLKNEINIQGLTFLIADSNAFFASICHNILRGFGATKVLETRTASDTVLALQQQKIDLLICDSSLPSRGGFNLTHSIRRDSTCDYRTIPILMLASDTRTKVVSNARDCGANMVIAKPMSPATLYDRLAWVAFTPRKFDASGAVTGMFGTQQDVTDRREAEAALAKANQELEQRVAERTAELAQEMRRREEAQMKVAQSQRLNAVGQLTAGIAHDFNNLLAVIGGGLEFVERAATRGLPAEQELIEASIRATRRGRELVQRMLTFARQTALKAEPTSIDRLVLDTLRLLRRTLGEEIEIDTRLGAACAVVSVDRNQLTNALLNLTLNARDAMPSGGRLTISTSCHPAEYAAAEGDDRWPTGEEIRIVIEDTGCGMTQEVRSHAFDPFFTTKPDGLGSGLGLSMVHGFVEQSGGHIAIDSAVGRGTTITIRLPRIGALNRDEAPRPPAAVVPVKKEKTVLLVEDDSDVRIVTSAQLKELGYNVHAVSNGLEAMDLIASPADIDITLTDLVLPAGIDGVRLVEEAMRARPRMGVLCMTGYDPTQRHRKWLKQQNIDLLEKPFSSTRLGHALEEALAH